MKANPGQAGADTSSFALLQSLFHNRILLSSADLAQVLGITPASLRTRRCHGAFAIPSLTNGRDHRYDIRDVAAYLDARRIPKPRRGAPTKAERMAKAAKLDEFSDGDIKPFGEIE